MSPIPRLSRFDLASRRLALRLKLSLSRAALLWAKWMPRRREPGPHLLDHLRETSARERRIDILRERESDLRAALAILKGAAPQKFGAERRN